MENSRTKHAHPKNVQNNNLMRAYLLDCSKLEPIINPNAPDKGVKTIFGWVLDEHKVKLVDFVETHQKTCAVYEVFWTTILIEVLWFCTFSCPKCGGELKVEVGG